MAKILKLNNLQLRIVGLGLKCLGTNWVTEKQQVDGGVGATGFVWFGACLSLQQWQLWPTRPFFVGVGLTIAKPEKIIEEI